MAVLFLLAAIVGCALAKPNVTPVSVTLYYETLCPGCRLFIPNQLYPAYTDTKYDYPSLISKLTLVPYGWAYVLNATTHDYQCQHGEEECQGNKLQGCALKYIPDALTTLEYFACLENTPVVTYKQVGMSNDYPIDKCQEKLPSGLYPKILSCYNSDEGWELFEENGKKTDTFFPSDGFVPYVSFNDKKDDDLADAAIQNFKKTLCKVAGVTDEACAS
ncbi:gamma-interferon-inducible lysosomal thiol reductase isoform X3 [Halyomorpha halys]|uniref:gamma-interferon-inducible lysosomal thiol reductase isoform X2 n=1 Tax=Halyomorpha halys TaxID=286706 RepID=UPI0006D4D24B|nr:gamma-interferon-inducible lysosomal thiol reductase isoform X2 [Halyomorpha halys]XP_014285172.1 gamma-interferon-inducible lysosomal thiol reductase isoform X3 [Halyomorpha halys]